MKIAVFVMSFMVMCICQGSISENNNHEPEPRHQKQCRFPKGIHGSVRTDGCIKNTCTNGKWKPKMRTDICCYKQQVHKPNTVLDTIVSADNCSSTTIGCGAVAQIEFNHKSCAATKQQVEKMEINLEQQIGEVFSKIENVTVNVTCGKKSEEIYKAVQEVDKKIKKMNNSIESKVDDFKNTTTRQSEKLSEKVNDLVQNIENNKITMENHVTDLPRKLENQTREIVMKMNQTEERSVGKFDNLDQTIKNQLNDLSNQVSKKLENQTEEIVIKMNQTEEQGKEMIQKIKILENQMNDLSDQVSKNLENQTGQIQTQGKGVVGKFQTLENQMDDLSDQVSNILENQTEQIQTQGKEVLGKIQTLENNVQEKLENQTEQIQTQGIEVVWKIQTLENNVQEKLENQTEQIQTQGKEVVGKIQTLENNVQENLENQTEQIQTQSKKVLGKIQTLENNVQEKLENQTEQIQTQGREVMGKIQTVENNVQEKLENQTEQIQTQAKEMVGKIEIVENQMNDLTDQVSRKLENQKEQIQTVENNVQEKLEKQTEQIQSLENNVHEQLENQSKQIQSLENNVQEKLEKQTKQIQSFENNVQENLENQTEKFQEFNEMFLKMMGKIMKLTELMEKHTDDTPMVEGVLITGGAGAVGTSTELFLPHTGKTCSLQSLPENRYFHSLNVVSNKIIMCGGLGGSSSRTSCLQFLPDSSTGSWVNYATLGQGRYAHTSHVFKDDLILMGGDASKGTTEIMGKGTQFILKQNTFRACSIPDQSSTILTGGYGYGYPNAAVKTVARYNEQGFVEKLPDMRVARYYHGCGSYMNQLNTKVLVVAGGYNQYVLATSYTELFESGATSWQLGETSPRFLLGPASVSMDSYVLFIGANDGWSYRGEVLMFNGTYTDVGMMKKARGYAAATKIKIVGQSSLLYIPGCY